MQIGRAIAVVAALMFAGCGDPPTSKAAREIAPVDGENDAIAPQEGGGGSAPSLDDLLTLKATKYAKGWTAAAPTIHGELHEGGRSDHLIVLRAGFCYRVLGVSGNGVEDLDLLLFDPDGVQVQQDPAQDRFPVLGMQTELCPAAGAGAFRLQVVMYKGSGAFNVGVYKTP